MRFNKIITLTLFFTFLSFNLNSYSQTTDTPAVADPPAEHVPVQEAPAQNPQAESAPAPEIPAPTQEVPAQNPQVENAPASEVPTHVPTGNSIIKSNCNKNDCSGCSSSKELSDRLGSIFKACCAASKNKAIGCSSN